jgi:formylglycine-generating enzyme required for sulfatase activity
MSIAALAAALAVAASAISDGAGAPDMVVVPAGAVTVAGHRVSLPQALAISRYPVTVGEFARFVAETGYDAGRVCQTNEDGEWKDRPGRDWRHPGFDQTDDSPVVCVNWADAQAYAAWLTRKTGRRYRLLSETEYEYANRAGAVTTYTWGDDPALACRYANNADIHVKRRFPTDEAGDCDDGFLFTAPVGRFPPNRFGLYDMAGNAWSWVQDCWTADDAPPPEDASARPGETCAERSLRGGSWHSPPRGLAASFRFHRPAGLRLNAFGFRVARELNPS